ncbi:LPS-assembly protein LptD [Gilvimarinus xylanilyticus]|uniref:LPS-assembly protein LptD n=1 Tax=Gilvimarinus xylanilyticus TaxID=2944139 RepID=A0A9X2HWC7_9GAMM|nr:LPS-assembly protein LptD [Gilvimarinus xylanilyticus]MCP8899380.1 LPS-assembly protein LptD [Gilvimarinus xylanilyticus]
MAVKTPKFGPLKALVALMAAVGTSAQAAPEGASHRLDWVPLEELPPEAVDALPRGCCGAYISPYQTVGNGTGISLGEIPIQVEANRSSASGENIMLLEEDVVISQGPRLLKTDRAWINQTQKTIELDGNITLREDGLLIYADSAKVNTANKDANLREAEFVLHQARIHGEAKKLDKFGDRLIRLTDGSFTTCEPDDEFWKIRASELEIDNVDNMGTARHARLEIKDIPVLYVPYLIFPVGDERQSGLLFPTFSTSQRNGFEYSQPIYWNIAPQMDATFTPTYMQRRGMLWGGEFRHLNSFFETEIAGAYLADDEGGYDRQAENDIATGELTPEEAYPHKGDERWMIRVDQSGGKTSRLKTRINYTEISDVDYLRDITTSDIDIEHQSNVEKFGEISYAADAWRLGAYARETRYLNEIQQKPYKELPHVFALGQYRLGDWQITLDNQYTEFDLTRYYKRPTQRLVVGSRLNTDYNLAWDKRWRWGFVTPKVGVKTLSYDLQQADYDPSGPEPLPATNTSSPSLVVPQASLDMGLFFERFGNLGGNDYIQTLEPRALYFYSDYEDHSDIYHPLNDVNAPIEFDARYIKFDYNQLFRTTRYTGYDRIDDANQLALGVTSRFLSARTGEEYFSVGVGQIHRFKAPKVALRPNNQPVEETYEWSEFAGRVTARVSDRFNFTGDILYNQNEDYMSSSSAVLEYADEDNRLVSLTYRYMRRVTDIPEGQEPNPDVIYDRSMDQVDLAAYLPVSNNWSIMARANYDFTFDMELDTYAGLEYSDCCYRVRVMWRKWLNFDYNTGNTLETVDSNDYDYGWMVDLQFKGLGSISDRIGSLLGKTVLGYEQREDNF